MKPGQPKNPTDLRRRAEKSLQGQPLADRSPRSADEMQRLIHELQVYQLELELQNEELRNSRTEVEKERERYTDLYDFAPVGYFTLDSNGRMTQINLTGARMIGLERSELLGQRFGAFVTDSDRSAFSTFLKRAFSLHPNQVCELELVNNNLPSLAVQLEGTLSPDRQTLRTVVVDITALKTEEEERKRLMRQLFQARKMKALGVLAGGISHEFNNLLAIILSNINLSQLKSPAQSKISPYLDNALTASLRSRDLVRQILTFSHQKAPELKPVNLALVLDEACRLLRSAMPTTIAMQNTLSPRQLAINADSTQVQEVLINLCNNAVRAMDGQGTLKIAVELLNIGLTDIPTQFNVAPGKFAKLSVQDDGSGMIPEDLERIFDPFFTTKGVGEGTGMGLAVVHGILETHGGFAKVKSEFGRGSTFEVYFPVIDTTPIEIPSPAPDLPRGNERILLIDDEKLLAATWGELLSEFGYQVTTETSSKKALEIFTQNPEQFDLVITDQTMPELTGMDLIKQLHRVCPGQPTILCTGYIDQINDAEALELGFSDFLMKPLDLQKLSQTIRQVLDKAKG